MSKRGIFGAAGLLFLGNLLSRLLGLIREQVIAALFGETAVTSAFQTAFTVPSMFYDLVIGGAVSAALVPVLSGYLAEEDREELGQIVGTLLAGAALVLAVLTVLLLFAAAPITAFLVPGNADARELTQELVQIAIPALFFLGLAGVSSAVCYARRLFLFPALSTSLFNVGIVFMALLFHAQLGVASLALGIVAGAALQLIGVLPGLRGVRLQLGLAIHHPALRRMAVLYGPVAAGLVISEVGVVIDRNLAWQTGEQSVAIMRFATSLVQLPLGLVATVTSLAALPLLAQLADDPAEFRQLLATALRLALLAVTPLLVFLVIFAEPSVRLIFERGRFDPAATAVTAQAFLLYAPQLPFVAVDQLLIYAFYARKNTLTPMLVGLAGVLVYLVSALVLIGPLGLGVNGLILANTLQNSLHAVVLALLLTRAIGSFQGTGVGWTLARAALAGVGAAVVGLALDRLIPAPGGVIALAVYLAVGGGLVLGTYGLVLLLLGVEEVTAVPRLLRRRLRSVGAGQTETA